MSTLALITWLIVDGISPKIFFQRQKDHARKRRLDYVIIFIGFRDICAQT